MEPWQSWTAFLFIGGMAVYYYYPKNNAAGRNRGRPVQRAADTVPRGIDERKNKGAGEGTPKAAKKAAKPKASRKAKKPTNETGEKAASHMSANSSTTGGEGDDDLSPAVSPKLSATAANPPSGRDVSDMLEPKAAPASVLRLTEPTEPVRQKQAHQPRPATPQETKKQRQNKKKAEEKKLQREQEEKERQALLEKQRRTAREARGEPAKNSLQQAKAPTSNAWNLPSGASNTAVSSIVPGTDRPLLDTFEQDAVSTASSSENATNGTSATTEDVANDNPWTSGLTEEEQVRLAMADSEWTTVPKGRKPKKPKATNAEGNDAGIPLPEQSTPKPAPAPPAVAPTVTPNVEYKTSAEAAAHYASNHPMDSDWPVV